MDIQYANISRGMGQGSFFICRQQWATPVRKKEKEKKGEKDKEEKETMRVGNVFTIEPIFCEYPPISPQVWRDNFTVVSKDNASGRKL